MAATGIDRLTKVVTKPALKRDAAIQCSNIHRTFGGTPEQVEASKRDSGRNVSGIAPYPRCWTSDQLFQENVAFNSRRPNLQIRKVEGRRTPFRRDPRALQAQRVRRRPNKLA
jgi:hypothetical protein